MEFVPMPKTPRWSREIFITEKIDGTNASVKLVPTLELLPGHLPFLVEQVGDLYVLVGSRTRWITPKDDNYGFASWVKEHAVELAKLGAGHHFGEWWGRGIQRAYGLTERKWSLFNVGRWKTACSEAPGLEAAPGCCSVVPILWRGILDVYSVERELDILKNTGSKAAPGWMDPEGVMVYHTAANLVLKKTFEGDGEGKERLAAKKERAPQETRVKDPNRGGRRKGPTEGYAGPKRRATDGV